MSKVQAYPVTVLDAGCLTPPAEGLVLSWHGAHRNVRRDLAHVLAELPTPPDDLAADLLDIASAVYMADIGLPRGRNEAWVRHIECTIPVRQPDFWRHHAPHLSYLLYALTRDNIAFTFQPGTFSPKCAPCSTVTAGAADCVSLLSGGIDSLAGAVMLLQTGRTPLFLAHESGNPAVRTAQKHVIDTLKNAYPNAAFQAAALQMAAVGGSRGLPFPPPDQREPSQRSRCFLYLSLALVAGSVLGIDEAFVCENGILTVAAPLSGARIGGFSTRSTHPRVISLLNELAQHARWPTRLVNPFIYSTKAELIRDILAPRLSPFAIHKSVSCWAAGRTQRQCGGCVACLIRRLAMAAANLPDEAYEIDVLGCPDAYRGTDAGSNLVDLLALAGDMLSRDEATTLALIPEFAELQAAAMDAQDAVAMYRRWAVEIASVVHRCFPAAACLL